MRNVGLIGIAMLASACAQGSWDTGSGAIDAPAATTHDAPHVTAIDARESIDAPHVVTIDAPPADACASAATCATAVNLGSVSGDTNFDMVSASGYQAAWYVVRVTEDDSGVFGVPMELYTQLTSPASEQYDLFVYVNTGSDVLECATPNGTATTSGTTESLDLTWGETGTFSNGADDSRSVSIEIRPRAGTCASGAQWQLTVYGDT